MGFMDNFLGGTALKKRIEDKRKAGQASTAADFDTEAARQALSGVVREENEHNISAQGLAEQEGRRRKVLGRH